MIWVEWICLLIATAVIMLGVQLLWAWHKLRTHPHVEPIEIAKPAISRELGNLVTKVAGIAGIMAPPVYIRRAALPNAFIVAGIFRPELFLTDELLEQCESLETLERIICHEIAHIKRGDAIPLGMLTLATQWSRILAIPFLLNYFQKHIDNIEHAANLEAEVFFQTIKTTMPGGSYAL